jgi:hypothetical protein
MATEYGAKPDARRRGPHAGPRDERSPAPHGAWLALTLPRLWAIVAVELAALVGLLTRLNSVDLAYQIRVGEAILRQRTLPGVDLLTFTVQGRPWLDQQWGAQVILALVHRAGGWGGQTILRAGLVTALCLLVFLACRRAGAGSRASALLTLASLLALRAGLGLRPQLFGLVLLALTLWILAARGERPGLVVAIPLLVALWANLHGSFVLAPVLLVIAWVEARRRREPGATRLLWVAAASVAAAIVNPFGPRIWGYLIEVATNPRVHGFVEEWQPPTMRDAGGAAFFVTGLAVAAFLLVRRPRATWTSVATLAAFFALGLTANRAVLWWSIVAPIVIAAELRSDGARGTRGADLDAPSVEPHRASPLNGAVAVTLGVVIALSLPGVLRPAASERWLPQDAPTAATRAVMAEVAPGARLFVSQPWASWFEFAAPGHRVFVDSRIELYPSEIWRDYDAVTGARPGWSRILDRWRVDAVTVRTGEPLLAEISGDPGWRMLFRDASGAVFVRTCASCAAAAAAATPSPQP